MLPMGIIALPITLGEGDHQSTKLVDFLVVDIPSVYNMILGRSSLYNFKAVIFVYYHTMKFSRAGGVGTIKGEQQSVRSCCEVTYRSKRSRGEIVMMTKITKRCSEEESSESEGAQAAKRQVKYKKCA